MVESRPVDLCKSQHAQLCLKTQDQFAFSVVTGSEKEALCHEVVGLLSLL